MPICRLCLFAFLASTLLAAGEQKVKTLDLFDEVVCRVNVEAISKRDVEERMEGIAEKLYAWKKNNEEVGAWDDEKEKQWQSLYIPDFRTALRKLVRERLMLQYAAVEKMTLDEKQFQKRYEQTIANLREKGILGAKGFLPGEVQKRVRENMMMDTFRGKFYNVLEQPRLPEIQKYYRDNIGKYQRKAGVKVRLVRIDRVSKDPLTGVSKVREKAYETAEELRRDVVEYGAKFAEIARQHTDDIEARERGGLIVVKAGDAYFDPDEYSPQLAAAIKGLKAGEVTKVFEFGQSYSFAMVEDRRDAGPAPLEGALYEEIYRNLLDSKSRNKEDEWFRKALSKSLVTHVTDGVQKQLMADFFFPDEKEGQPASAETPKK